VIERIELLLSFLLIAILLGSYGIYAWFAEASGGQPVGLLLGLLGLLLMLLTETLYSFRKRVRWFRFGPLRLWLSFHIVTGLVGPALVLGHSAFVFRGLAGLALALTLLVVLSGFVGRYIYTAVPRSMAGVMVSRNELAAQMALLQAELERWAATQSDQVQAVVAQYRPTVRPGEISPLALLLHFPLGWRPKQPLPHLLPQIGRAERQRLGELEGLLRRRQILERQIASLKTAQRLLRGWRRVHIPLGLTLFTTIAIHIGATVYYGALVR
jgi:hypothetical protein